MTHIGKMFIRSFMKIRCFFRSYSGDRHADTILPRNAVRLVKPGRVVMSTFSFVGNDCMKANGSGIATAVSVP
jgi:hypothetical protein